MVDANCSDNIVINEGEILTFMPNEVYIVNEPLMFSRNNDSGSYLNNEDRIVFEEILLNDVEMPAMPFILEDNQVTEGLSVLEILCNQEANDQANFPDVNDDQSLTEDNDNLENNVPTYDLDDYEEDDDVIFVGAYHQQATENDDPDVEIICETAAPRRNPVRRARNSKITKNYDDEVLYEEDFSILDSSGDEDDTECISLLSDEKENQNLSVKDLRSWPVNGLHERPEYNSVTNQIEKFDYTIRDIQKSVSTSNTKKSKIEQTKKLPKKNNKKYVPKRKRKTSQVEEKKVEIVELQPVVNSAFEELKRLRDNAHLGEKLYGVHRKMISEDSGQESKDQDVPNHSFSCLRGSEGYEEIFMNGVTLFAAVNDLDLKEAYNSFCKPFIDSEE